MHRIIVEAGPKERKLGGELSGVKYSREKINREEFTGCALPANEGELNLLRCFPRFEALEKLVLLELFLHHLEPIKVFNRKETF